MPITFTNSIYLPLSYSPPLRRTPFLSRRVIPFKMPSTFHNTPLRKPLYLLLLPVFLHSTLPSVTHANLHAAPFDPPNYPLALFLSTLAGASTGLGGLVTVLQPNPTPHRLGLFQAAAAGFMLSVSIFDLAPAALADLDLYPAAIFFLSGALLFLLLKLYIPEPQIVSFVKAAPERKQVLLSGMLTAAGIALHNLPEGVAVCVASLKGLRFGLPLAIAIGLHNIPEGMAVALPLWFATGDKMYAVRMAFWSGMAEPLGVLVVLLIVKFTGGLSQTLVAASMSVVTGIMVVLSIAELMPQAVRHAGRRDSLTAMCIGLIVMTLLLRGMESLGLGV